MNKWKILRFRFIFTVIFCFLSDTQEAPKTLSLPSSNSMESLASVAQVDIRGLTEGPRLGGAFASYVRHRGEPDGKTMETPSLSLPRLDFQDGDEGESRKLSFCVIVYDVLISNNPDKF